MDAPIGNTTREMSPRSPFPRVKAAAAVLALVAVLQGGSLFPAHAGLLTDNPGQYFGSTIEAEEAQIRSEKADEDDGDSPLAAAEPEPFWSRMFEDWSGKVELGLHGSSGNTELLSLRTGLSANRSTEQIETTGRFSYNYATRDGQESQNRARLSGRNDWLQGTDSRWRAFISGDSEYNRFQAWNWRLSGFGGFGFEFIDSSRTFLLGRAGAGGSREFGSDDDRFHPEAVLGVDFRQRITERQSLTASTDLFPELDEGGRYRVTSRAEWEVEIDPDINLGLTLGVENRFDSSPGRSARRSDLDYYAVLVWTF